MSVRAEDGQQQTYKLSGPGAELRYGVGKPEGPRSSVWRLQADKGEIYIGTRDLLGFQKVSLHESDDWRFAWTKEKAPLFVPVGEDRILDRWPRPPSLGAAWTLALRIYVASADVTTLGKPSGKRKSVAAIRWLPTPGLGSVLGLHIVVFRPDQGEVKIDMEEYTLLNGFTMARSDDIPEACLILSSESVMTPENRQWLDGVRNRLQAEARDQGLDLHSPSLRGLAFGYDDKGTRMFWDLALGSVAVSD